MGFLPNLETIHLVGRCYHLSWAMFSHLLLLEIPTSVVEAPFFCLKNTCCLWLNRHFDHVLLVNSSILPGPFETSSCADNLFSRDSASLRYQLQDGSENMGSWGVSNHSFVSDINLLWNGSIIPQFWSSLSSLYKLISFVDCRVYNIGHAQEWGDGSGTNSDGAGMIWNSGLDVGMEMASNYEPSEIHGLVRKSAIFHAISGLRSGT